jgi:hypothetical protein
MSGKLDSAKMAPKVGSNGPGPKTVPSLVSPAKTGSNTSMANSIAPVQGIYKTPRTCTEEESDIEEDPTLGNVVVDSVTENSTKVAIEPQATVSGHLKMRMSVYTLDCCVYFLLPWINYCAIRCQR